MFAKPGCGHELAGHKIIAGRNLDQLEPGWRQRTGFQLDDKKFVAAFEKLAPADAAKMSDAQKAYFDKHLLVIYGVLMGGELAAMAGDVSAACAQAAEFQADPEVAEIIVWK